MEQSIIYYLFEAIIASYTISTILSLVSGGIAEVATLAATLVSLGASGTLAYAVLAEKIAEPLLNGFFIVDPIGVWGLLVVSLLGFAEALYSIGYIRHNVSSGMTTRVEKRIYYMLFNITMLVMALSVTSNNIVLIWVSVEATTIATALLVGFYKTTTSIEASWKYVIICSIGVSFALFGTVLVYDSAMLCGLTAEQAMTWLGLVKHSALITGAGASTLLKLGLLLVIFGYSTKAGIFPLHSWLPDAHSEAPSPISAILSGVIVKCALIAILRFLALASAIGMLTTIAPLLLVCGIISLLIGGLGILAQKDVKRLFAYSTIDQIGVIATGAGLATPLGILAAVMHILYHALAKGLAFMGAGMAMTFSGGKRDLAVLRGLLGRGLRFTAAVLMISMLGIAAVPPGPSFYSKVLLLLGAGSRGILPTVLILVTVLIGEIAIIYKIAVLVYGGLREKESVEETYKEEGLASCKASCILLAVIVIMLFVLLQPYVKAAGIVAGEIMDPVSYLLR